MAFARRPWNSIIATAGGVALPRWRCADDLKPAVSADRAVQNLMLFASSSLAAGSPHAHVCGCQQRPALPDTLRETLGTTVDIDQQTSLLFSMVRSTGGLSELVTHEKRCSTWAKEGMGMIRRGDQLHGRAYQRQPVAQRRLAVLFGVLLAAPSPGSPIPEPSNRWPATRVVSIFQCSSAPPG